MSDPPTRRACEVELLRWWFTGGHAADVARDLARATSPRLFAVLRSLKRMLPGASRGPETGALP